METKRQAEWRARNASAFDAGDVPGIVAWYSRDGVVRRGSRGMFDAASAAGDVLAFATAGDAAEYLCTGGRVAQRDAERRREEAAAARENARRQKFAARKRGERVARENVVNKSRRWGFWHRVWRYSFFVRRRWSLGGCKRDFYRALREAFVVCKGENMFNRIPAKRAAAKYAAAVLVKLEELARKSYSQRSGSSFFAAGAVSYPRTRENKVLKKYNSKKDIAGKEISRKEAVASAVKRKIPRKVWQRISRAVEVLRLEHDGCCVKFSEKHVVSWLSTAFAQGKKWPALLDAYRDLLWKWNSIAAGRQFAPSGLFHDLWKLLPTIPAKTFAKLPRKRARIAARRMSKACERRINDVAFGRWNMLRDKPMPEKYLEKWELNI